MPKPLQNDEIQRRLHDFARSNYLFLGSVTKGVVLSIATLVLLQIVGDFRSEWMRLSPWVASFTGIVVSYVTWDVGTVLSNSRTNTLDAVLPLLMGVSEFLLFGVLWKVDKSTLWLNWLFFSSTHSFLGALIVWNRIRITDLDSDFEDSDVSKVYDVWLQECRKAAARGAVFAFVAWLFQKLMLPPGAEKKFQSLLAILITAVLIRIILNTTTLKRRVDELATITKHHGAGT